MSRRFKLPKPLHVGDVKTIQFDCFIEHGDSAGSAKNPSSATVLVIDRNRSESGTADSGSASHLVDVRSEADDFWIGVTIVVAADSASSRAHVVECTDWTNATDTLIFGARDGLVVAAGDTYETRGYPTVPRTAATVASNGVSYQWTPVYPSRYELIFRMNYGSDVEENVYEIDVLPSSER